MKNTLKKIYRKFFKKTHLKFRLFVNTRLNIGNRKQCYVCKVKFHHFGKFRHGSKNISDFLKNLQTIGSDTDNFNCFFCGSTDRTRHLFMFFDKLGIWEKFNDSKVLHFAPEPAVTKKITSLSPAEYTMADLNPKDNTCKKIDVTAIPYENSSIDIIICNHVLEHVPDYKKALQEIFRVLTGNGFAILQTPYSLVLNRNFEEENIITDILRVFFYAQEDHVRLFSQKQLFNDIRQSGFDLKIVKHYDLFDDYASFYFGVNKKEDLIMAVKPI